MTNKLMMSVLGCILMITACNTHYAPKPRGYHRLIFPDKSYQSYFASCPFSFNYPLYAEIQSDDRNGALPCWLDLAFPSFNARLHLSYYPVSSVSQLNQLVEDARTFAFAHTVKATAIDEGRVYLPEHQVYGIFYQIDGNAASAVQFYVTDSTKHYLRGALYFNEKPRADSLQPVVDFIKTDLDSLIKSLRWQ